MDRRSQTQKFYQNTTFSGTGVLTPTDGHRLFGENHMTVTIENVDNTNVVVVQAKLRDAASWVTLDSLVGSGTFVDIDISNYDLIRFNVSTYSNSSGVPKLIASAFYHADQVGNTSGLNSTATPLSSGATYTGTGEKNEYSQVGVQLKTDNSGTMFFDFSNDGINWDSTYPTAGFIIQSGITEFHTAVKLGRWFRVRLVNDTGAQTYLRLKTYYGNNFVPSVSPNNQSLGIDQDSISTRPTSFDDEVVIGRRSGIRHFNKFAYRTALTAAAGEETIWATTGNFTILTSASTFTIAYNNATDGLGTTGALTLYFDYIDSDGLYQIGTHTLSNTGSDVTSFSGLGINRCSVASSGSATYNTNAITITATTGGTKQAIIPALGSTTQQAIFHTDSNSDAIAKFLFIESNKISGGATPKVVVKAYAFNRAVATRFEVFRVTIDTSSDSIVQITDPVGFKLSPGDVLYFTADTDTNNTDINIRFSLLEYKRD